MMSICSALWLDANDVDLTNFNVQNLKLDIIEVNSIGLPIGNKYNWKPYMKPSAAPWLPPFSMRSFSVDFQEKVPRRLLETSHQHFVEEISEIERCIQNTLEGTDYPCASNEDYNKYLLLILN